MALEMVSIFIGTIDANDAKMISHTLDNIYNHSSNTILLVKKQTTIVKNLITKIEQYENQHQKDIKALSSINNDIQNAININKFNNLMLENLFIMINHFEVLDKIVESIDISIQADHTNVISPLLITPQHFIGSLQKLAKTLISSFYLSCHYITTIYIPDLAQLVFPCMAVKLFTESLRPFQI